MMTPYQKDQFLEDEDQICSDQELKDKLRRVAEEISTIAITQPIVLNFFTNCPELFVKSAVTIPKLHRYVTYFKNQFQRDTELFGDILVVFQRKLTYLDEVSTDQTQMLNNVVEVFWQAMNQHICAPPQLFNQFIGFQLAAHSFANCQLHSVFSQYLLNFEEINFAIFCRCLTQFIQYRDQYSYDFQSVKVGFSKMIEQQFEKCIESNYSETGDEIQELKTFLSVVISVYRRTHSNPFQVHIFNDLVGKSSFSCIMFSLLRKIGKLKPFFKQWVQMIISLGKYREAMDLVQFALSFYTSLSLQLEIVELIREQQDWAREWIEVLMNYKFLTISPIFLNGVPHYFTILNKLLLLYRFRDQYDFNMKLDQLGYEGASRALNHNEETRQSMLHMLREQTEDADELYHLLLRDELE